MKHADLALLFRYNDWANDRILDAAEKLCAEQLSAPSDVGWGSLRGTLVHLMEAEYAWRSLLEDGLFIEPLQPTDFADAPAIRARWATERQALWAYFKALSDSDLAGAITYEVDGRRRQRVRWHCLAHIVNHGTQHRAECAALLTGFGHSPGDMDFTVFLSSR